jgi:hypothetical protein
MPAARAAGSSSSSQHIPKTEESAGRGGDLDVEMAEAVGACGRGDARAGRLAVLARIEGEPHPQAAQRLGDRPPAHLPGEGVGGQQRDAARRCPARAAVALDVVAHTAVGVDSPGIYRTVAAAGSQPVVVSPFGVSVSEVGVRTVASAFRGWGTGGGRDGGDPQGPVAAVAPDGGGGGGYGPNEIAASSSQPS